MLRLSTTKHWTTAARRLCNPKKSFYASDASNSSNSSSSSNGKPKDSDAREPVASISSSPSTNTIYSSSSTKRIFVKKLRNGLPSFTQKVSIRGLVGPTSTPDFTSRITAVKDLPTPDFDYVVHPTTMLTLSHSLDALLAAQINSLPSVSSGLLILSCPYRGADLYTRSLLEHHISTHPSPILYLHVRPEDIFPRLSGHDVVNFPPIISPADSAEATTMNPPSGSSGKKKSSAGVSPGSMFGNAIVVEVATDGTSKPANMPKGFGPMHFGSGGGGGSSSSGELEPDVPSIPYPWYSPYITTHGTSREPRSLMMPRIQSEYPRSDFHDLIHKGFDAFFQSIKEFQSRQPGNLPIVVYFEDLLDLVTPDSSDLEECELVNSFAGALSKCRESGVPIVVVTGSTPSTRAKLADPTSKSNGSALNPLTSLVKAIKGASAGSGSASDSSSGGASGARKQKPVKFYTKLDDYIGPVTIPVYPPVHLGAVALTAFQRRMKKDLREQFVNVNRREIESVFRPFFSDWESEKEVEGQENKVMWESWLDIILNPSNRARKTLEEKILSPGEIEEILLYAVGHSRLRKRTAASTGHSTPSSSIQLEDLQAAVDVYAGNVKTLGAISAGAEFAGVFANPADHLTLTKHESEILKTCLIKPSDLHASFKSIGGLAKTKQVIEDLIQLPLMRPELFSFGVLKQSTTGLLLFGPPGTGKTLLAKSIASSSGANFLNIQMSSIQSKWVGENEKNVKSIFSLARKLKPCVIFVDEIDALLKVRVRDQPHWVTNTINEWMLEWDGINSKGSDGIIVVGATNRPFDLDEAVLRRLPRRLFVSLPDATERYSILDLILAEETVEPNRASVLQHVVGETEGFSGSDLKNLCIAAALGSVRRVLDEEKSGVVAASAAGTRGRVLKQQDFVNALESGDVVPSLSDKAELMKELVKWDKLYGIRAGGRKDSGGWGFDLQKQSIVSTSM